MRRMGLSYQRELYVCIADNLGMRKSRYFAYYANKGCDVKKLGDYTDEENTV